MVDLPPGIAYLTRNLPILVVPPATVIAAWKVAERNLDLSIPTWALVIASVLSLPLAGITQRLYLDANDAREARKHGAILAPEAGKEFGGIGGLGLLRASLKDFADGYIGMSHCYLACSPGTSRAIVFR